MKQWIKDAVIYEIYPVSFCDANGDGIGDLKGITSKIPYLKDLGINTVWLNPCFKSPFRDGGYDVSDYCEIDKKFGTMADFEEMVNSLHAEGIRLVVDFVAGHTSDKHPWFKGSRKQKPDERYKDFYIWTTNGLDGEPRTVKGVAPRDGTYMINFYEFQPALNFGYGTIREDAKEWQWHYTDERLKPLRDEMIRTMKFYLKKGVDGFRVDMAASLVKADFDRKGVRWLWNEMIGEVKKDYPDCCFLAEWGNPKEAIDCGFDLDYLCHSSECYNELFRSEPNSNIFRYMEKGHSYFHSDGEGSAKSFFDYAKEIYDHAGDRGGFSIPTGYHDVVRIHEQKSDDVVKCIYAFILTTKAVPQIYYGDEIGIKHNYSVNRDGGFIRTGARTPMQWTTGKNFGFSEKTRPYLPVDKVKAHTVEEQQKDENSLLNTLKKLIAIHKKYKALSYGEDMNVISSGYPTQYERGKASGKIYVAINPSARQYKLKISGYKSIISNNAEYDGETLTLNSGSFFIAEE